MKRIIHTLFKKDYYSRGVILLNVLVFATIAIVTTTALITWATTILKASNQLQSIQQALQIAEAGVDYYRWHLAHAQSDYTDGNGANATGPFIHTFMDKDGNVIGQYALTITPPPIGSTVVVIKSKGTVVSDPTVSQSIQTTLAIPSLAQYAVAANDVMRFGVGTEVFGPIESNSGIRFDGLAHNVISSAAQNYTDTDSDSCNLDVHGNPLLSFGVHTCVAPSDPAWTSGATPPSRPDVFSAGRQFPVPAVDFVGMTTNLSQMKTDAISSGKYFAASGAQGYYIQLKTNDTFDIYKVTALTTASSNCVANNLSQTNWGTWTIQSKTFLQNYPFPANGIIFVEDNLWIDGQINTARLTIAAGKFPYSPATQKSITVNNNLLYTNFNGQDVISLISQGDINTGLGSADTLTIDGALVAQNGRVGRYYYASVCGTGYTRTAINLFGMIATDLRYGFAYTDGTGYQARNITYDTNLLYAPPPEFPLTSSQYSTISWDQVN